MKLKLISLAIFSALVLQACGGSDGDSTTTGNNSGGNNNTQNPNVNQPTDRDQNSGQVAQSFTATAKARYILVSSDGFSSGAVNSAKTPQNSDGSYKVLGAYSLTGTKIAVQNIAGNADYAIGRWSWGTVNYSNSASGAVERYNLQDKANDYINYAVFNQFESAALGKKACKPLSFTQPYLVKSSSAQDPILATTTGTATFDLISLTEAKMEISLNTTNGKNSRTSTFYPGKKADYLSGGSSIISNASVVNPATSFISNGE